VLENAKLKKLLATRWTGASHSATTWLVPYTSVITVRLAWKQETGSKCCEETRRISPT